jgi:hypothetical protein
LAQRVRGGIFPAVSRCRVSSGTCTEVSEPVIFALHQGRADATGGRRERSKKPNFADLDALEERVLAFIDEGNAHAHPFRWTARSFDKIIAKIDAAVALAA